MTHVFPQHVCLLLSLCRIVLGVHETPPATVGQVQSAKLMACCQLQAPCLLS